MGSSLADDLPKYQAVARNTKAWMERQNIRFSGGSWEVKCGECEEVYPNESILMPHIIIDHVGPRFEEIKREIKQLCIESDLRKWLEVFN